jgi:hypothetical protein
LLSIFKVGQAKVPITTINIRPISAASGTIDIRAVAKTIKSIRKTHALIQDNLHLAQLFIFIIDCHIIAQPQALPKNQQAVFAIN